MEEQVKKQISPVSCRRRMGLGRHGVHSGVSDLWRLLYLRSGEMQEIGGGEAGEVEAGEECLDADDRG